MELILRKLIRICVAVDVLSPTVAIPVVKNLKSLPELGGKKKQLKKRKFHLTVPVTLTTQVIIK